MTIANILVPIFGSKDDALCLATAFTAARPFNAHVQVLFTRPDPRQAVAVAGMPLSGETVRALVEAQDRFTSQAIKQARISLATEAEKAQVRIVSEPTRSSGVTASYQEVTGHLGRCVESALRFSDIVVLPHNAQTDPDLHGTLVDILTRGERPVLLSPAAVPVAVGSNIAIGWDGSMTAAHALTAALPFMRNARLVTLVAVSRKAHDKTAPEASRFLALHGIDASVRSVEPDTRAIAEILLETAVSCSCDLLVIGGYGHSHLRESIFGGVTKYVLSHATVPVFLAH
jgi:nucleotide-binding universal stress UspA family protein